MKYSQNFIGSENRETSWRTSNKSLNDASTSTQNGSFFLAFRGRKLRKSSPTLVESVKNSELWDGRTRMVFSELCAYCNRRVKGCCCCCESEWRW